MMVSPDEGVFHPAKSGSREAWDLFDHADTSLNVGSIRGPVVFMTIII
jgi:hypothetical protein